MRKSDLADAFNAAPAAFDRAVEDALAKTRREAAKADKKRRRPGFFRAPVIAALVIALLILGSAGTYALLNTGFNVMQRSDNEVATQKSMIAIGDTLYVNDGLSLRSYAPGDADSCTLIDAIVRHADSYYRDSVRQPMLKGKYFIDAMVDIDGALCGLNLKSGLLFQIGWENGQGVYTDLAKLNLKKISRGSDGTEFCDISSVVVQDDTLYFINWNQDSETRAVGAYSLKTGDGGYKKTGGIRLLAPYKDGKLLAVAEMQKNGESAPWLCVYDPTADELESLLNLSPVNDSVGALSGLEYSLEKDCAYITESLEGIIYSLPGLKSIEKAAAISSFGMSYCAFGRTSALVRDTYYCTADMEGVYVRNVDAGYQSPLTIGLDSGVSLRDDALKAASQMSGVDVDAVSVDFGSDSGLQEMLLTRDDTYDIYVLSTGSADLSTILEKGYAPEAPSDMNALQRHFDALYPMVQSAVSKNGKMCAVPIGISPVACYYNQAMLDRLGIDAPPADFPALIDLAESWINGEIENLELGDLMLSESLSKYQLARMAMNLRVWQCQAKGELITLDDPGLRAALTALQSLDGRALSDAFTFDEESLSDLGVVMQPLIHPFSGLFLADGDVKWLPFTLNGGDATVPCQVTVAIVNPYGSRQAEAWEYLNAFIQTMDDVDQAMLYPERNEPIENPAYAAMAEDAQHMISTAEGRPGYEEYKESILSELELNHWKFSETAIRAYRAMMQRAFVAVPNPLDSLAAADFDTLLNRYMGGAISLDQFLAEADRILTMTQKE